MKPRHAIAVLFLLTAGFPQAHAEDKTANSKKTSLKNWALAACLGEVNKDKADKDDANLTAYAYAELGRLSVEDEDVLLRLAKQFADRQYGGSVPGEYNTKKCIDLFHSSELDQLARELVKVK